MARSQAITSKKN